MRFLLMVVVAQFAGSHADPSDCAIGPDHIGKSVTLHFSLDKNINETRNNFMILRHDNADSKTGENVLNCVWTGGDLRCVKSNGTEFNNRVNKKVSIVIDNVAEASLGTYKLTVFGGVVKVECRVEISVPLEPPGTSSGVTANTSVTELNGNGQKNSEKESGGNWIVGVVIGVLVAVGMAAVGAFCIIRRHKNNSDPNTSQHPLTAGGSMPGRSNRDDDADNSGDESSPLHVDDGNTSRPCEPERRHKNNSDPNTSQHPLTAGGSNMAEPPNEDDDAENSGDESTSFRDDVSNASLQYEPESMSGPSNKHDDAENNGDESTTFRVDVSNASVQYKPESATEPTNTAEGDTKKEEGAQGNNQGKEHAERPGPGLSETHGTSAAGANQVGDGDGSGVESPITKPVSELIAAFGN